MFDRLFGRSGKHSLPHKTVHTSVAGVRLTVHPTVFHPKFFWTSVFLARYLRRMDLRGKRVLDCGTGTGILGIVAAQRGAEVTAIDINDLALEAAKENAERNGVAMRLLKSDWFSALDGERFDYIVCNPPSVKEHHTKGYGAAVHAGDNHEHVLGLIEGCDDHLAAGGALLLVLSRHADVDWWLNELGTEGLQSECVARSRGIFDGRVIFRFAE